MFKISRISLRRGFAFLVIAILGTTNSGHLFASEPSLKELYRNLATAKTELEGRTAESALWEHWFSQSPTTDDRAHLDAAIDRREAYDFEAAEQHLDKLVASAPSYAEGYNQRAFIRFLRDNNSGAKTDLESALALEPKHFGAWAGMYLVLSRQSQQDEAFKMLQKAVSIHPWLRERSALPKALWPLSYRNIHDPGQDI